MCTFNGERFLTVQLASIASQTVTPSELVVCDDGSTDSTVAIVRRFAERAPFPVRLTVNDDRLGSTKNFERAIALCEGEVIFLADQDDVWRPDKVAAMTTAFHQNPGASCLFTDAALIDETGARRTETLWQHIGFDERKQRLVNSGEGFELMSVRNFATGATMAFRNRLRELLLPIPTDHAMLHDRWIVLLCAAVSETRCLPEPLIDYRSHAHQQLGAGPPAGDLTTWLAAVPATGQRQFAQWAAQLRLVEQRLRERRADVRPRRLFHLAGRIQHLETRAGMSPDFFQRLMSVAGELAHGRYHRYSNHVFSAAKDLFRAYRD